MGILLNGNKPSKIIYNGAESSLYFNGSKIWPDSIPVGPQQYKFRIQGLNGGLITCKYLKCNNVFPDEPYTYKDQWSTDARFANYMIQGQGGGTYYYGGGVWMECTFYFTGTLSSFKYTTMDSRPSNVPSVYKIEDVKITLTNLTTNTVVLNTTVTMPSYNTTYTFTL